MDSVGGVAEEVGVALRQDDIIKELISNANAVFNTNSSGETAPLQNILDALTAKVAAVAFETVREPFDTLIRLLRSAYGQIARFVNGDFREQASFYQGQLHALTEITHRLGHQHVPREAMELVARSKVAKDILTRISLEKSIGAGALAQELGIEESNLSKNCKPLVKRELLRRNRFGKRVRYSPTPLTFAVLALLNDATLEKNKKLPSTRLSSISADLANRALAGKSAVVTELRPNVVAGNDAFVSGLLTLAAVRGASTIAISPTGRSVYFEGMGQQRRASELNVPSSVCEILREQVRDCSHVCDKQSIDWHGQTIEVIFADGRMKVMFAKSPDPQTSRTTARAAFQQIQNGKERLQDFENFFVSQVLEGCEWHKSEAADTLGIQPPKLDSLIKDLNITAPS